MNRILISTTNSIEGAKITKYLGIVSSNVVVGTDVFSDFVAALSDFFGGTSGTYKNQLQRLYSLAIDEISDAAVKKRADGVIGLHIDFDEISGKGKSMFMVSIIGTAVNLQFDSNNHVVFESKKGISLGEVQLGLFKKKWEKRKTEDYPTEEDWTFIFSHEMPELSDSLYQTYLYAKDIVAHSSGSVMGAELFINSADKYFEQLDYDSLTHTVYNHFKENPKVAKDFVLKYKLFNATEINNLLHSDSMNDAILLLASEKEEYTVEDVSVMKEIVSFLDNLPDKGTIEEVKGGLLSSSPKLKYICPHGHKNDAKVEFCTEFMCGLNIKGLVKKQVECINIFKEKTEVLTQLLKV